MTRARDLADLGSGITSGDLADDSITTAKIADANVTQAKLAGEAVNESKLQVSNAPTNGYALTAQSGNTGGMTWAEMAGGATEFIASSGAISGAASVVFTQFDATKYDNYQFFFQNVRGATDGSGFVAYMSTDGGSSYLSSYRSSFQTLSYANLHGSEGVGNASGEPGVGGFATLVAPHVTTSRTMLNGAGIIYTSSDGDVRNVAAMTSPYGGSSTTVNSAVNAIKFQFFSGNITSGEIVMYGIKNS
jgi:hypothetical protein